MKNRFAFVLLICCSVAAAQFNKSDIDDLKADLLNYADSKCTNETYRNSAMDIIGKLNSPMSNTITAEQARANDQMRDAMSVIREGIMASVLQDNKSLCEQKIRAGIPKLDSLPIKSNLPTLPTPSREMPASP